jgi:hypothetical protein
MGPGKAARPIGRQRHDKAQLACGFRRIRLTDLQRQLSEGKDAAQPVRHAGVVQFLEHWRFGGRARVVDPDTPLVKAVPQHRHERALAPDVRFNLAMLEFEMRAGPGDPVPDQAARPHQRMKRVHADEHARGRHAAVVQPAHEAVDQLLERHVAQARVGEPRRQAGDDHGGDVMPMGAPWCPSAATRSDRKCRRAG